jgi:hypothetical protein
LVKGRALARPSERSERFEPIVIHATPRSQLFLLPSTLL